MLDLIDLFYSCKLHNLANKIVVVVVVVVAVVVYSKEPKSLTAFDFIHILSYRYNPIRSQLETVLDL